MVARMFACLVAVAVCLCLMPQTATAADPPAKPPPTADGDADDGDALMGQARKLHRESVVHFRAGRFDKAYAALVAAWALKKHYRIAGPLGACELKLGKYRDAAEHLRFFLDRFPPDGDPNDRRETEKLLVEAASKVVQLTVQVTPANASLRINGASTEAGQLGFYEPGTFTIEATREGYLDARQTPTLQAGTTHTINLTLIASDAQPPPPSGIDGRLVAGIAMGVGALAGFGVGIGATVVAGNRKGDAMEQQAIADAAGANCAAAMPPVVCTPLLDAMQAHNTALDVSDGGFIAGGVLAAGSLGLLLWWALDPSPSGVQVAPAASRDAVSLSLIGKW